MSASSLAEDARILADAIIARGVGKTDSERVALASVLNDYRPAHEELLAACQELLLDSQYAAPDPNGGCECGAFVDYVPLADEPPSCIHTRALAAIALAEGRS